MTAVVPEKEAAANRRAMPLQRLIGNGMEWADAHELHRRSERLEPWHVAASEIGENTRQRAEVAAAAGRSRTAAELFLFASAAFRFGQNPLPDGPEKLELYRELIGCYRAGVELIGGVEHVEIQVGASAMQGWLHLPTTGSTAVTGSGVVIVLGGFDGWREEFHIGARHLVDRGLAVLLMDGPGQGETRLSAGWYLPESPEELDEALSAIVSWARARGLGTPAVWGNSMGGYLAARLACRDDRVAAVCVNGGTDRPAEILDRYPRFVTKVQGLYGSPDPVAAAALLGRQVLTQQDLGRVEAAALIMHGEPDQIFLVDSARRLAQGVRSADLQLRIWPDGDHCLYNHTHEKNTLVADWFAERLLR